MGGGASDVLPRLQKGVAIGGGGGVGVRKMFYPVLRGGGAESFGPAVFPFSSPPIPIINDQSLSNALYVGYERSS